MAIPHATPIDPLSDENKDRYLDDRSFVFCPCQDFLWRWLDPVMSLTCSKHLTLW
jgi:hypothetical protein